jgi:predicted nucleotidyltransferase
MAKTPAKPEEIFQDIVKDYQEIFGADLVSIILYGSGARGDYIPKKSDINFLIILSDEGINKLGRALKIVVKWHKRRVSTPLFLTKSYVMTSLDTFPIEFLNLRSAYKLVYGEDILHDLSIDKHFLRLQCERELKGKLLQLRENFLESEGRNRDIVLLIAQSISTFLSLFRGVLFLKGLEVSNNNEAILQHMSEETGLHKSLFLDILAIKKGKKKLTKSEAVPFMESYIKEIRNLSKFVDAMEIKEVSQS